MARGCELTFARLSHVRMVFLRFRAAVPLRDVWLWLWLEVISGKGVAMVRERVRCDWDAKTGH